MPYMPLGEFDDNPLENRFDTLYAGTFYLGREMLLQPGSLLRSQNFSTAGSTGFRLLYDGSAIFYSLAAEAGTLGSLTVEGVLTLADPTGQLNTGVTGGPAGNWFGLTGGSSALVWYINDGIGGTLVDAQLGFTPASGSRVDTLYSIGPLEFPWNVQPALTFTRGTSTNDTGIGGSDSEVSFWAAGSQVAEFNASGLSMTEAISMPDTKNIVFGNDNDWIMRWDHAATEMYLYYGPSSGVGTFNIFGNSSSTVILKVEGPVLTGAGSVSNPPHSFILDPDTGAYRYGVNQYAIAAGGIPKLLIQAGSIQAQENSNGLVEIFPKNYIAAGTDQTSSVNLTTTETQFGSKTIACEYANQPVLVTVRTWLRVVKSDNLVYTWLRVGINGTAKGAQVPLIDSATGASRLQMLYTEWTEEVTADGSGNVTVGAFAKVESGTSNGNVVQVTYRVDRR